MLQAGRRRCDGCHFFQVRPSCPAAPTGYAGGMGNPSINLDHDAAPAQRLAANGILGLVPGNLIASAMQRMPTAGPELQGEAERTVLVDVPDHGWVRLTLRLDSYKHGRSRFWHWKAVRADAESVPQNAEPPNSSL